MGNATSGPLIGGHLRERGVCGYSASAVPRWRMPDLANAWTDWAVGPKLIMLQPPVPHQAAGELDHGQPSLPEMPPSWSVKVLGFAAEHPCALASFPEMLSFTKMAAEVVWMARPIRSHHARCRMADCPVRLPCRLPGRRGTVGLRRLAPVVEPVLLPCGPCLGRYAFSSTFAVA